MMPSVEELNRLLAYNPETGSLTWRVRVSQSVRGGSPAGNKHSSGYVLLSIKRKLYAAHRAAFAIKTGVWPEADIDHMNGVKNDNRWGNLREASGSLNSENLRRANTNNRCGFLGVSSLPNGTYRARIQVAGRPYCVGVFSTPEEAHKAYLAAKRARHAGCTI